MKRRSPKLEERLTPCECCGYPVSQRHHVLPVARYGDHGWTVQLCANCHEAYHILEQGWIDIRGARENTHAVRLFRAIWHAWGGRSDPRIAFIIDLIVKVEEWRAADARQSLIQVFSDGIQRGDFVRLSDGRVTRVVGVFGGRIHTSDAVYEYWQVERVSKR
jgi:hypothetical protein